MLCQILQCVQVNFVYIEINAIEQGQSLANIKVGVILSILVIKIVDLKNLLNMTLKNIGKSRVLDANFANEMPVSSDGQF